MCARSVLVAALFIVASGQVVDLTAKSFGELVIDQDKTAFVKFYAPW
jgi:hypothetical protein